MKLTAQLLLQMKTDAKRRLLYFQHGRHEINEINLSPSHTYEINRTASPANENRREAAAFAFSAWEVQDQ
jgi:hypothetical protein